MRILIVEDDPASREFLLETLVHLGHAVEAAADGLQALKMHRASPYDAIITDVQMPRMDGLELLRQVRLADPAVIVVMVTAFGSENYVLEALRGGANDYLRKPLFITELKRTLERCARSVAHVGIQTEIARCYTSRSFTMRIPPRLGLMSALAEELVRGAGQFLEEQSHGGLRLGFEEMLMNALEHGCLGITYEEKSAVLESPTGSVISLMEERLRRPELAARSIRVSGKLDPGGCEWTISDDGDGFDWRNVADPTLGANLELAHGRGIFLSRLQFDQLEYLGNGNTVRIVRRRRDNGTDSS